MIALERGGNIVEQGTFDRLRSAGGYVQSLDIKDTRDHEDNEKGSPEAKNPDQADRIKSETKKPISEPEQVSDRSIFMYYFSAVRLVNLAIITTYIVIQGFIVTFRCKSFKQKIGCKCLTCIAVWVTWWGNGKGHPSTDVGYWLGIFTTLAVLEGFFISIAIM